MTHRCSTPRHHTVQLHPCAIGRDRHRLVSVPVLLSAGDDPQPLEHFIDYIYAQGKVRSVAWQRLQCLALGLYIDYLAARPVFPGEHPTAVLREFAEALRFGTRDQHGDDPLALFWHPRRKPLVARYLSVVDRFSDWLAQRLGTAPLNPQRPATAAERMAHYRSASTRKSHALLGHLHIVRGARGIVPTARAVTAGGPAPSVRGPAKAFDESRFEEFLYGGFPRRGVPADAPVLQRNSLRDMMIVLLMHGGGLRESEPFHLFTDDVFPDPARPGNCIVRLFHPSLGKPQLVDRTAQPRVSRTAHLENREAYLRETYGREPRHEIRGTQHAGFKDLLMSDEQAQFAEVHWFEAHHGVLFFQMYCTYLRQRPPSYGHPYLFVSERGAQRGEPYTVGAFQIAHRRACKRIGLHPTSRSAVNPHAHRHAYARRAKSAGLPREVIRHMLHHRSLTSQDIYGDLDALSLANALSAGQARLESGAMSTDLWEQTAASLREARWTATDVCA